MFPFQCSDSVLQHINQTRLSWCTEVQFSSLPVSWQLPALPLCKALFAKLFLSFEVIFWSGLLGKSKKKREIFNGESKVMEDFIGFAFLRCEWSRKLTPRLNQSDAKIPIVSRLSTFSRAFSSLLVFNFEFSSLIHPSISSQIPSLLHSFHFLSVDLPNRSFFCLSNSLSLAKYTYTTIQNTK